MENLKELLKNRRSIRKYTEDSISPENVKEILEAALMSPTSKRSLCWEFVVIENPEQLEKLSHCKAQGAKPIAGAKLAIVILADPSKSDVWIEDASIAAILIQLQAEDLGLGSCWIQIRNRLTENGQSADASFSSYLRKRSDSCTVGQCRCHDQQRCRIYPEHAQHPDT